MSFEGTHILTHGHMMHWHSSTLPGWITCCPSPSTPRPSLLILDEAFDGLDKSSRVELASELESFFDESPRALATLLQKPVLWCFVKWTFQDVIWDGDGSWFKSPGPKLLSYLLSGLTWLFRHISWLFCHISWFRWWSCIAWKIWSHFQAQFFYLVREEMALSTDSQQHWTMSSASRQGTWTWLQVLVLGHRCKRKWHPFSRQETWPRQRSDASL